MKRLIHSLILFLLLGLASNSYASSSESEYSDTIIKVEGKVLIVNVVKVTTTYVRFKAPDVEELLTIPRKEIHKIIYSNGRIEEYFPLVIAMIDENAWQAVWITEDKQDVAELHRRGEIKAQAPKNYRSSGAAKKNAIIRLQKKAAALQGQTIYITKKHTTGGYGEMQGYYIEGIAYGLEPLAEEDMQE